MKRTMARSFFAILTISAAGMAAPPARLARAIDPARTRVVTGSANRQAQAQADLGEADASLELRDITLLFKPSDAQQRELDQLLADQQNPSSANYHRWLTPEEFGD